MPDILIRDLDPLVLNLLERHAGESGRSIEEEIRRILELAAHASDMEAARELADRISAEMNGHSHSDSAALVREIRDRCVS
jgi:hypothetical protein